MTSMKFIKETFLAAAVMAAGSFTVACTEDTERPDSRFWIGDQPVQVDTADNGLNGGNSGYGDLSTVGSELGDGAGESSQPGEYGEFTADGQDYVDGFGRRISNAPDFSAVYFAFDTFAVPPMESAKVDAVAVFLKSNPATGVVVEGNCDERGTQEYNRALGERRAIAVKTALIDRGIAAERIATLSYGEDKPAVFGDNDTAWGRNRRAEFVPVLLNGASSSTALPPPAPVVPQADMSADSER